MRNSKLSGVAACLAATLLVGAVAHAEAPAAKPQGEITSATVEGKATVLKVDQATREVTLKLDDGQEASFVASQDVKNLPQVKAGDIVRVKYSEVLEYKVHAGGTAADHGTVLAGGAAPVGERPAAALGQQTAVTVAITAIDRKAETVTVKGPQGNSRTIKVQHPEKLEGVAVGDTVELVYTEALAIRVDEAPTK